MGDKQCWFEPLVGCQRGGTVEWAKCRSRTRTKKDEDEVDGKDRYEGISQ